MDRQLASDGRWASWRSHWIGRPQWIALGLVLATSVLMVLTVWVPQRLVPPLPPSQIAASELASLAPARRVELEADRLRLEEERVRTRTQAAGMVLQAFGGLVLVAGAIATWMNVRVAQQRHALDREAGTAPPAGLGGVYRIVAAP